MTKHLFLTLGCLGLVLGARLWAGEPEPGVPAETAKVMRERWEETRALRLRLEREGIWPSPDAWPNNVPVLPTARQRELEMRLFEDRIRKLETPPPPPLRLYPGKSRMARSSTRRDLNGQAVPEPPPEAEKHALGPEGAVVPLTGEIRLRRDDFSVPGRAGMDFAFIRFHRSFTDGNSPLGPGWDHNHNLRLLAPEGADPLATDQLLFHTGSRTLIFRREAGQWRPEPGFFLALSFSDDGREAVITTPDLGRLVFERLVETPERGWRIAEMSSRHDGGKANRLRYDYPERSDLLAAVVDVWGNEYHFTHTPDGLLERIDGSGYTVVFAYDDAGRLASAVVPRVARNGSEAGDVGEAYRYDHDRLSSVREEPEGPLTEFRYGPDAVRVTGVVVSGGGLRREWLFERTEREVRVTEPAPRAATVLAFDPTQSLFLPTAIHRAGDGQTWRLIHNTDGLPTENRAPEGWTTTWTYDSGNPDPRRRGDLLSEVTVSSEADSPEGPAAVGWRAHYHAALSLPLRREYFEREADGRETILNEASWEYEGDDFRLKASTSEDVRTAVLENRQGETMLLRVGTAGVALFHRAVFPGDVEGNAKGPGRLVRRVDDADPLDARLLLLEMAPERVGEFLEPEGKTLFPPVALETRIAYDVGGRVIREQAGSRLSLSRFNRLGQPLASYDSGKGLSLHEYDASFRWSVTRHAFSPAASAFPGTAHAVFSGVFYIETGERDGLGRLAAWSPTDEPDAATRQAPRYVYDRYPAGTISSVTNPLGVVRRDEYDPATGFPRAVTLRASDGAVIALETDREYHPSGAPRQYRSPTGALWQYRLDGLGRPLAEIRPDGVVSVTRRDGLDRPVRETLRIRV